MHFTSILSLAALLSSGLASPLTSRGCFPEETHTQIQDSQVAIGNLINNIYQADNTTGKANLIQVNGSLDSLSAALKTCDNPAPGTWPPLSERDSQARAISMLRDSQDALSNVDQAAIECDDSKAESIFCSARKLVSNIDVYYES